MPRIRVHKKGSFDHTEALLSTNMSKRCTKASRMCGEEGVEALRHATPTDTGKTANSWYYEIQDTDSGLRVVWKNSNVINGWFELALMLQYGHATRTGGYVQGRDYINPAMRPVMDKYSKYVRKGLKK